MTCACLVVPLVVLAAAAPTAAAERLYVGGGLALPVGDYAETDGAGFHVSASVDVPLGPGGLDARLDVLVARTAHDVVDGNTRTIGGMVGLSYRLPKRSSVTPYLVAGAGIHNVNGSTCIATGFQPCSLYSNGETKPSFGGGGGVTLDVGRLGLFFEGRVIVVKTSRLALSGPSTTLVPLTIGVSFPGKER